MNRRLLLLSLVALWMTACSGNKVKETINQAGDAAGQATGEFVEGIAHGVGQAFEVKVETLPGFADKGISFGKTWVSSDSVGNDNLLTVYVIYEKDFRGALLAKAYDNKGLEMGRVSVAVAGQQGEAKYVEFHFDPHANLDSDSKVTVE